MSAAEAAATRLCARIIGAILLIVGAIVLVRAHDLALIMPAILQDGALSFVTGIFTLICGCVLFAAHHHWNSAAAFVISLLGVLTIVRGVLLMLAPGLLFGLAQAPGALIWVSGALALLLGAWLSYVGWRARGAA